MADQVQVRGAEQLEELGKRLKQADATALRQELRTNLRNAVKPVKEDVQKSLREGLPKGGGLAAFMAKASVGARVRTEGRDVGVRVIVQKGKTNVDALDAGTVYHPVFGRFGSITRQSVHAGLISKPLREQKPALQRAVFRAMESTSHRITN